MTQSILISIRNRINALYHFSSYKNWILIPPNIHAIFVTGCGWMGTVAGWHTNDIVFKCFNSVSNWLREESGGRETAKASCGTGCSHSLLCLPCWSLPEAERVHRNLLCKWHFKRNILLICKTERLIFTYPTSEGSHKFPRISYLFTN